MTKSSPESERIIKLLHGIQQDDRHFREEVLETSIGTFCARCQQNLPVAMRPFWHRFPRMLCDPCGVEYEGMLKEIGAWD